MLETVGPSYYRLETGTGDGQWTTFDEVRTTHHPDGTGDARYFGNRGVSGPGWTETWYEESNGEVVENESYHMPVAYHDDQPNSYDETIPHDSPESGEIPTPYHEPPALQPTTPTGGAMGPGGISAPEDPSEVDGLRNQVFDDASMAYETNTVNDQAIVELTQTTGALGDPEDPNSPASENSLQGAATMAGYAGSQSSLPNSANPAAIAAGAIGEAIIVSRDRDLIDARNFRHFLRGMAYGIGDGAVGFVDGIKTAVRGVGQYGYFVWVYWTDGADAAAGTSAGQAIDSAAVLTLKYGPEVARIIQEIHTGQLSPETLELIAQVQPLVDEILDAIAEEFNSLSAEEQAELIGRITTATIVEVVAFVGTGGTGAALVIAAKTGKLANITSKLGGFSAKLKNKVSAAIGKFANKVDKVAPNSALPYGFFSADEFGNFGSTLVSKFRSAGFDDVQAVVQGSAVTGVRARAKSGIPAGTVFDALKQSDFDVALISPKLFSRAKELNIPLRGGQTRTAPLRLGNLRQLNVGDLPESLLKTLYKGDGRQINFMIFESMEEALKRGPSIGVPGI